MEDWAEYTTVVRKYEVKIADYRHRTTNKARSKLKKKTRLLFSYFASRMSFEKVRDALVYSLVDDIIDEEEFVLLFDAYKSVNLSYRYWEYDCFCLDSFDSSECLTEFRVNKEDLSRLAEILGVPPQFRVLCRRCKSKFNAHVRQVRYYFNHNFLANTLVKDKKAVYLHFHLGRSHFCLQNAKSVFHS